MCITDNGKVKSNDVSNTSRNLLFGDELSCLLFTISNFVHFCLRRNFTFSPFCLLLPPSEREGVLAHSLFENWGAVALQKRTTVSECLDFWNARPAFPYERLNARSRERYKSPDIRSAVGEPPSLVQVHDSGFRCSSARVSLRET